MRKVEGGVVRCCKYDKNIGVQIKRGILFTAIKSLLLFSRKQCVSDRRITNVFSTRFTLR